MHGVPVGYGTVTILLQFSLFETPTTAIPDRNTLKTQYLAQMARFSRMERQADAQTTYMKLSPTNQIHQPDASNVAKILSDTAPRSKRQLQSIRPDDATIARKNPETLGCRLPQGNFTTPVDTRYSTGPVGRYSRHLSCYVLSIDADQETNQEANYSAATKRSGRAKNLARTANSAFKCLTA